MVCARLTCLLILTLISHTFALGPLSLCPGHQSLPLLPSHSTCATDPHLHCLRNSTCTTDPRPCCHRAQHAPPIFSLIAFALNVCLWSLHLSPLCSALHHQSSPSWALFSSRSMSHTLWPCSTFSRSLDATVLSSHSLFHLSPL